MKRLFTLAVLPLLLLGLGGCGNSGSEDAPDGNHSAEANPLYRYAWHLHTPDTDFADRYNILPDAHVHAEEAWQTTTGHGVRVAVIDDYFEPSHPDIRRNVVLTYNAKTGGSDVTAPPNGKQHGQLCAGILAAASNDTGLTGIAPDVELILIGSAYQYSDAEIIRAFEFARTHGADIVSCSWGSYKVSAAVADEIKRLHDDGITIVFAAGNQQKNLDEAGIDDESELPWVIGVSASSEYNTRATYANFGSALDLMAPGGEYIGIPSTDPTGSKGLSPDNPVSGELLGDDYAFFRGTSASAPLVAGACALLKAADPGLSPDRIREILIDTADKIGSEPYNGRGFSAQYAYGKLNVAKAVSQLIKSP